MFCCTDPNRRKRQNLLASLAPLIEKVVDNHAKYSAPRLRIAATLALAKFMMISERFCRKHLRLLFTILHNSDNATIRKNTIIAIGDLCVRYPNLIDAYSSHMYRPLSDPDLSVRSNALKVLTRLILADMLKAKSQVSDIAKMVVDDDENLASYARFFFQELKKRDTNAISNVVPEIVSQLSDPNGPIEEEKFRHIMKFIFELMDKDKQTDQMITKFCERFKEPNM